jgi:predicted nucleotide-binding protein
MAGSKTTERKNAHLSFEQMKAAISMLQKRIEELESFEIRSLESSSTPELDVLRKKVNTTLQYILGGNSVEYEEYELGSFYPWYRSVSEIPDFYKTKIREAVLRLQSLIEIFMERIEHSEAAASQVATASRERTRQKTGKVFIVHGHDDGVKASVARFIEKLGFQPVILHEQANEGRTIIEKFEAHADADFAVVLFTPDDMGYQVKQGYEHTKPRARQNVVLELGFFMGSLGRNRVAVLHTGDLEMPSDYSGVLFIPLSDEIWTYRLAKEMKAVGLDVDLNRM